MGTISMILSFNTFLNDKFADDDVKVNENCEKNLQVGMGKS